MSSFVGIYLVVGFVWSMFALLRISDNPKYSERRQILPFFLNSALWPIAVPVWAYAKLVLGKEILIGKIDEK